jgi:hypothetical protein
MLQLVDAVFHRAEGLATQAMLFAADTNAKPESLELEILRKVLLLQDAYLAANGSYAGLCTYCGKNPLSWDSNDRVIDFVLFRDSPTLSWRAERAEINLKGSERAPLSDHYGVRSLLAWEERPFTLLELDSEIVLARRKDAALVLGKAAALLEKQRKTVFKKSAGKAREQEAMFLNGLLSPAAETIFRLP